MIYFFVFIALLIVQRLAELFAAKKNEKIVLAKGAIEYDAKGYKFIVIMHVFFFISMITEFIFFSRTINEYWYIFFLIFLLSQALRYWAITSLGVYWNVKILVIPYGVLVNKGPYKFLKHPNYIAVITELAVIPLIFSCYFTAIFLSVLNLFVLKRRIRIEEMALGINKLDYVEKKSY